MAPAAFERRVVQTLSGSQTGGGAGDRVIDNRGDVWLVVDKPCADATGANPATLMPDGRIIR